LAVYSAARDGWPCDVSVDARREAGKQYDGEEATTIVKQQAARTTYLEHTSHVRHRAHVPVTDGLIELPGILHCNKGRRACDVSVDAWREAGRQYDGEKTTIVKQQAARTTYSEHLRHGLHRARVPITDGLIEGLGLLQHSERRAAVRSEQRSRSEGIGNGRRRR
jgi:hypothetical protein